MPKGYDSTGGPAINAQKIMVCTATEFLKGNEDVDDIQAGSTRFYLVRWADTKTEILKNRLKETFLDLAAQIAGFSTAQIGQLTTSQAANSSTVTAGACSSVLAKAAAWR